MIFPQLSFLRVTTHSFKGGLVVVPEAIFSPRPRHFCIDFFRLVIPGHVDRRRRSDA